MKPNIEKILMELIETYPELESLKDELAKAYLILEESFCENGQVLIAGNGGSSCDSAHIVGELMKGFMKKRPLNESDRVNVEGVSEEVLEHLYSGLQQGLRAIDLTSQQGLITAVSNDNGAELVFAQQVWGYGKKGDVFIGLSTSGNSENVIMAGIAAKSKGMKVIGFSGDRPCKMDDLFDVVIKVPSSSTPRIQEFHLPIYHTLCMMLEERFF